MALDGWVGLLAGTTAGLGEACRWLADNKSAPPFALVPVSPLVAPQVCMETCRGCRDGVGAGKKAFEA